MRAFHDFSPFLLYSIVLTDRITALWAPPPLVETIAGSQLRAVLGVTLQIYFMVGNLPRMASLFPLTSVAKDTTAKSPSKIPGLKCRARPRRLHPLREPSPMLHQGCGRLVFPLHLPNHDVSQTFWRHPYGRSFFTTIARRERGETIFFLAASRTPAAVISTLANCVESDN